MTRLISSRTFEDFQTHLALPQPPIPNQQDNADIEETEDQAATEYQAMVGPRVVCVEVRRLADDGPRENI